MGMSILYGGSFLPIESTSETFLYFSLWAQDHIMRPGQSYYAGPGPGGPQLLGPWALVPGPGFYEPEPNPCRLGNMIGPDAQYILSP